MSNELIDKDILINKLNTLNNEYKQRIQELNNKLNDKEISLNEYKERLNTLNNMYEKEKQEYIKKLNEKE